ncbi:MAG: hypothetical protein E7168_03965 [Firmicutes bacterium]|nr:hypothetical protein [Bacillota bacterium]
MYNDTIKVANKIITDRDLMEIFEKMYERLEELNKIYHQEKIKNLNLNYSEQVWSLGDFSSSLKFDVNFYDDTRINFDNYQNFIGIFNQRLSEIKSIYVYFRLSYNVKYPGMDTKYYSQHIFMDVFENKFNVEVSLSSSDRKIEDIYELIKEKILNALPKYDRVIKKKSLIINKIRLALGLIIGIILSVIFLFVPAIRDVFSSSYVLFPICCMFLGYLLGAILIGKVNFLYETLIPEKKYVGYDSNKGKSIYKDDIDLYTSTGEILIGKNTDNLEKRAEIETMEKRYSKLLPYEFIIILAISIIILFL